MKNKTQRINKRVMSNNLMTVSKVIKNPMIAVQTQTVVRENKSNNRQMTQTPAKMLLMNRSRVARVILHKISLIVTKRPWKQKGLMTKPQKISHRKIHNQRMLNKLMNLKTHNRVMNQPLWHLLQPLMSRCHQKWKEL